MVQLGFHLDIIFFHKSMKEYDKYRYVKKIENRKIGTQFLMKVFIRNGLMLERAMPCVIKSLFTRAAFMHQVRTVSLKRYAAHKG